MLSLAAFKMLKTWLVLAVALVSAVGAGKSNFINFKSFVCPREEKGLGRCLRDVINAYIPRLAKGLPEYGVPACEPLLVPEVRLRRGPGALAATLSELAVRGPSAMRVSQLQVDRKNRTIVAHLHAPQLKIKGRYAVTGELFSVPIQGDGICTGNYSNVNATVRLVLGRAPRAAAADGLSCEDLQVDLQVGDAQVLMENLFGGNPQMGSLMNKMINENWSQVSGELRSAVESSLRDFLKPIADRAFATLDADEILE